MTPEIRKSVNATLYERTTSPLYGALITSWCIWNWKIIYLTLFVDKEQIFPFHKIDYILCNYWEVRYLFWYPLISTVALLTIIPLFAIWAYWLDLWFTEKKVKWKEHSERDRRFTKEQAAALMNDIADTEAKYTKRIESKDDDISLFQEQIRLLTEQINAKRPQEFRILYARYGYLDQVKDVTLRVITLFASNDNFIVENETLQGDPSPGVRKELIIIYEFETLVTAVTANENDKVAIVNNKIEITNTPKSTSTAQINKDLAKLIDIMPEEWQLSYTHNQNKKKGGEKVRIENDGKYYANGKYAFNIQVHSVNKIEKKITFSKVATNGALHSTESLTIVSDSLIEGTDDKGYTLQYKRIGSGM